MWQIKRLGTALLLIGVWFAGIAGDWPQWRGPNRDGHVARDEQLPDKLPPVLTPIWRKEIGGGFSSPVVQGDQLVYLDAQNGKEVAHLCNAKTGKEIWHTEYADEFGDEWGTGPRSTPIIDEGNVYVQSCSGEFRCLSLTDGKVVWRASFEKDFGVRFMGNKAVGNEGVATRRGNNGSGVIEGDKIFVPVGGTHGDSLVCFDKRSGKIIWKSQSEEAAYSALLVATLAGARQVLYFSADSLMGLALDTGKLLWRVPLRTNAKRHAAMPVVFGDSVTVNSHTFGLLCLTIKKNGDGFAAEQRWANRQLKINIATPVLVDHWLYSQGAGNELVCVDALTGEVAWAQNGFGEKYSAVLSDGKRLLIMTDRGELILAGADPRKFSPLGRAQACGKTWQHPAWAGGRLYVREGLSSGWKLSCFDLGGPRF